MALLILTEARVTEKPWLQLFVRPELRIYMDAALTFVRIQVAPKKRRNSLNIRRLMLGNEAIAQGLVDNGCSVATSYPGTPASEILSTLACLKQAGADIIHVQWAVNEKIAFEIAYAASMAGLRTAVSMKQVGLNVASDSLMSAAYMGTTGGFVIISADDPGPHSSQTEQDSRLMAMMAKIPVLDPDSPRQAKDLAALAFEISEAFEIPVMLRPTTRVCHARQDILLKDIQPLEKKINFQKAPERWAAIPKFRFHLHKELEKKLEAISSLDKTAPIRLNDGARARRAVIAAGIAAGHIRDIMKERKLWDVIPLYQVLQPYPLHQEFISHLIENYDEILVLEETSPVIEMQIADRHRVKGRLTDSVPKAGELLPEVIEQMVCEFADIAYEPVHFSSFSGRRPTLCAGCPHRASFFAIKQAVPHGIYTGDIGCYTLGLNLGAVDTVLCMGAAISQAAGFYHAYKGQKNCPDIVATIGDSTFFHAGIPALIDAVVQNVSFVLLILDNRTTAMTGNQPTPASGISATGEPLEAVDIERVVGACGIRFCHEVDPYNLNELIAVIREAVQFSRKNGPAVIISRHPCLTGGSQNNRGKRAIAVEVSDACDGCRYCIRHFECPALIFNEERKRVFIDPALCNRCGVCIQVCPKNFIQKKGSFAVS